MKKNDFILIVTIIFIALLSYIGILWYGGNNTSDTVCITVDGDVFGTYPLYSEHTQYIQIGSHNKLEISDGFVRMIEADCPDALCMHQGAIHRPLESIVCLPNKVVIEISNSEKQEFDAIVK